MVEEDACGILEPCICGGEYIFEIPSPLLSLGLASFAFELLLLFLYVCREGRGGRKEPEGSSCTQHVKLKLGSCCFG